MQIHFPVELCVKRKRKIDTGNFAGKTTVYKLAVIFVSFLLTLFKLIYNFVCSSFIKGFCSAALFVVCTLRSNLVFCRNIELVLHD